MLILISHQIVTYLFTSVTASLLNMNVNPDEEMLTYPLDEDYLLW